MMLLTSAQPGWHGASFRRAAGASPLPPLRSSQVSSRSFSSPRPRASAVSLLSAHGTSPREPASFDAVQTAIARGFRPQPRLGAQLSARVSSLSLSSGFVSVRHCCPATASFRLPVSRDSTHASAGSPVPSPPFLRGNRRFVSEKAKATDTKNAAPAGGREPKKGLVAGGRFSLFRAVESLVNTQPKSPPTAAGGGEAGGKAAPAGAGALRAASAAEGSPADAAAAGKAQAAEEAGEPCVDRQTLTDEGSHWLAQRARRRAQALSGEASLASAGGEPAVQQGPEGGLARKPVTVVFAHAASLEETSPSSASSSFALFLRSLLPRLFLLPADASSVGAATQRPPAVSSKPAPAPLLSPTQHRHLPFDLVSVDISAEPHLGSYLALSSVPSLVCFYDTKTYAVLTPGASDAALLRFLREAADIAEASPASPAETTPSARVAPTAVAEAVREARAEAAQAASVPQRERAAAAGVSAWISRKISETDAAALVGAWAERKRTQSLLARLKTAMRRRQATEVRKLRDELAADDRPEELELSRGRRLFAELQLHLERDGGADRAALSALLTEILGNALSLPSGLRGSAAAEAEARDAATAPRALYPGDARGRRADAHESWAVSPYAVRGFMNELETEPAFARLLARATVALFDQERAALNELEEWTARIEERGDKSDWAAMCADMPESLRDVLETEEPVRPLDEAVHYAHVTLKNERDLARYRPSVFFLAGSPSLLDCPLRTLSRLCRIRAARQFSRGCVEEDALALAVRAYRLESQGAAEGSRDTAPAHVLGTWRDDEAALQTVEASYDKLGGNGQEDLFDQMACQRAGWPARTLVMAMYMALGAKHPAVQRSRAELEVLLGTDGFVPVIFPHTRARAGGKPIMMRGKSGKWHWLGPYWKPPWAPSNKVRWLAGREEWSWSNPAR